MKMKKLTQIVIATLLTASTHTYAETLTLQGRGQILASYSTGPSNGPEDVIRKNIRATLYNPNNFDVKVHLSSLQQTNGETVGDLTFSTLPLRETITVLANSGYIYDPLSSTALPPLSPSFLPENPSNSISGEIKRCDLDMHQSITQSTNSVSNCLTIPTVINISWQEAIMRGSDTSIKTVAPITGSLDYYYFRDGENGMQF